MKSTAPKKWNVMMNFIIRPYQKEDFPLVTLLEESGLHESYRSAVFIRQMAEVCSETFLVAVREDGVIGYTIGTFVQHNPAEAWILRLGVREDQRRTGAGTALLRAVIFVLYKHPVHTIRLSVSPGNQPALDLYRKQGFVREKCIEAYFGPAEDRIIMKKERD
jgi:ribosomal protein S18 acetylase RimI-like enzyme